MGGVSPLDELAVVEEIKRIMARRDRSVDLNDWDTYRELPAPDRITEFDGYEERWTREDVMEHLTRTIGDVQIIHRSHTPDITIDSPDMASRDWYLEDQHFWKQGDEEHWLHGFDLYYEKYVRRDGRWYFIHRDISRILITALSGAEHPAKAAVIRTGHFRETRG